MNAILRKLKTNKAPGPDGITKFLKYLPHKMKNQLLKLMNLVMQTGETPESWENTNTIMIYKKGNKLDPNNYRGIALANTVAMVFTAILAKRISKWCESYDILPEGQTGFRENRSCEDNVFVMHTNIVEALARPKGKIYILFVDFRKAFDSIWHSILWRKLHMAGISSQIIRVLNSLYHNANTQIKINNKELTNSIGITKGVLQGDSLSPTLFSLMLYDIDEYFKRNGHRRIEEKMELLSFADDMVLIADNPIDMQEKVNTLHNYCIENRLEVNTDKRKLLVCRRSNKKKGTRKIMYSNIAIEEVKEYTYLGIPFTQSGRFYTATKHFVTRTQIAIGTIWKPLLNARSNKWEPAERLFESIVKATLLYGAGIWGLKHSDEIEKVQTYFIKRMLGVPRYTPGYMVRTETGRIKLEVEVMKRALRYWRKITQMREKRFPRRCWEKFKTLDKKIPDIKRNWVTQIRNIIQQYGYDTTNLTKVIEQEGTQQKILEGIAKKSIEEDRNRISRSTYSEAYKNIKNGEIFKRAEYLNMSIPLVTKRIMAQVRLAGKLGWTTTTEAGIRHRIDETLTCRICNTGEEESRDHILCKCPIYEEIRPSTMKNREWIELVKTNNEKQVWGLTGFIRGSLKLRAFCLEE